MSRRKSRKPLHVFLSFAHQDKAFADELMARLSRLPNIRVFTPGAVSAGGDWASVIKKELSRSDIFIVLLSPEAIASSWVLSEMGGAWGLSKPNIQNTTRPWLVEKNPLGLSDSPVLDFKETENPEVLSRVFSRYEADAA